MKGNLTELKKQYEALGEEIKNLEDNPFVPGWYMYWDDDQELYHIEYIKAEHVYKGACWDNIVPVTQELLNKFLPKMYDWSKAPTWAQWAITDADGVSYWYCDKPRRDELCNRWMLSDIWVRVAQSTKYPVNWKESLEERPHDR